MAGALAGFLEAQVKSTTTTIIAGIILMSVGVLLLLDRLGVVESGAYVPALMFTAVGGVFLALYIRRRENWWAAIPGSVFLGLAAVAAATRLTDSRAVGALLFLFMAAGFGAVYVRERANWWAFIPCGVMLTLAVIVTLPEELQGTPVAIVLFLGLAATFGLLSLLPVQAADGTGRMRWPLIPAAVLGMVSAILALQSVALFIAVDFAVLTVMILAGVGLLVYGFRALSNGHGNRVHGP